MGVGKRQVGKKMQKFADVVKVLVY